MDEAPARIYDAVAADVGGAGDVPAGYKRTGVGVIPEGWKTKRLRELGHFLKGNGVRRDEANNGPFACVRYGEIYTRHNDHIREFHSWISSQVAARATRLQHGDLLFAGSGETKEEIGKCVALVIDTEAYAGGDIVILRLTDANAHPHYLGYALNAPNIAQQKASFGQGDAVVHISGAALGQIKLPFPSVAEQRAIAEALSDVDGLLESLDVLIAKKRTIKLAAMQQLLTGKTRLPSFNRAWRMKKISEVASYCNERNRVGDSLPVLTCSKHLGFVDSLSYFKNQVFSKNLNGYKIIRRNQIGYPANHIEEGSIGLQDLYDIALVSPIYVVCSPKEG